MHGGRGIPLGHSGGGLAPPPPSAPCRVVLSEAELPLAESWVYIGRGSAQLCLGRSPWANPFVIGVHRGRHELVRKNEELLNDSPHLLADLASLSGCALVCHCALHERCRSDAIIASFLREFQGVDKLDGEARLGAGWVGDGPPIQVGRGARWRDIKEGGGLCSPGR